MEKNIHGTCKLCSVHSQLELSHIVPKFFGKWLKKTSITNNLRNGSNNQRSQDTDKEYWLCGKCEDRLSKWETEFSKSIFHPMKNRNLQEFTYKNWMAKFCVSVAWRVLRFLEEKNDFSKMPEEFNLAVQNAEIVWREFLLGQRNDIDFYSLHFILLNPITTPQLNLPTNINLHRQRSIGYDIVTSEAGSFVYVKLPGFIILGALNPSAYKEMISSRIYLNEGLIRNIEHSIPFGLNNYMIEKARNVSYKLPPKHEKKFTDILMQNPEAVSETDLFKSILLDYKLFGNKLFKK